MRAAELLGRDVLDPRGRSVGRVLDIQVTREPGSADPGRWRITGLTVGHRWALTRAGYAYGSVSRPWPLALIMRALARHVRYAAWDQLDATGEAVRLRDALADLPHPGRV